MIDITGSEVALLNSGSLRYDDQIKEIITEGDIVKALPFGGSVCWGNIKGEDLKMILDIGLNSNKGIGGYLQSPTISFENGEYFLNGKPLESSKDYKVRR